jgi:signal transduction histidine kinase
MSVPYISFIFYGLAFFSMGLVVMLEGGRAADERLRQALRPLAAFGLTHGLHEWLEMFLDLKVLPGQAAGLLLWEGARLALLAFSFLSLATFGASLLSPSERARRLSLLVPLLQVAVWGLGLLLMRNYYSLAGGLWQAGNAWTRYVLAIPSAILASAGLVAQQRAFRKAGLTRFGRDSLWAAVAFAWYGLIGQAFAKISPLPPSTIINEELFLQLFGFPVQVLRAATAVVAAIFVIRFLRSFEVEAQRRIAELQAARLEEARRREELRGELLHRVVAAQETERQRIACELHDATGQALTALGLGLRGATTLLRQDIDQTASRLRKLESLSAEALDELRHLISDLRPSHLDDLGLASTLRWYAKELQSRVPLEIVVEITGEERALHSAIKIALFRVAQEALNNVIKHSQASCANVRLHLRRESGVLGADLGHGGHGHHRFYDVESDRHRQFFSGAIHSGGQSRARRRSPAGSAGHHRLAHVSCPFAKLQQKHVHGPPQRT